ncbi:MAG: hypothetical protein GX568_04800 [Candidatus Gastranaerophilales bacterium]|nr:hypothetical protein [Candidatus Gastranaerophilales bacterium]
MNKIHFSNNVRQTGFKGVDMKKSNPPTIENKVVEAIEKLQNRAELEVAEYGDFKPVEESFPNPEKDVPLSQVTLKIRPDSDKNAPNDRFFEVYAHTPGNASQGSHVIKIGTKQEILETLQNEDLAKKVAEKAKILAQRLKDKGFA